jgi:hypothetical protein
MFDSGKSVNELITELKDEVDIALEIPDTTYIGWLNRLEQFCYSEIIKEQREITVSNPTTPVLLSDLTVSEAESPIRFEDIYAVYADGVQLMKTTLASGQIFPDTFYKHNDKLGFNSPYMTRELKIIYFARPKIKASKTGNVMFPVEFMDLVKAKMRGEAYKLANEDEQAGKWINDYNAELENLKVWCNNRASQFGV